MEFAEAAGKEKGGVAEVLAGASELKKSGILDLAIADHVCLHKIDI